MPISFLWLLTTEIFKLKKNVFDVLVFRETDSPSLLPILD
jgi:hypothetical protein